MFLSLRQAQLQFAAEFVTLVVTASTLALLLLRPPPTRFQLGETDRRRPARLIAQAALAGAALLVLAGAAFVHGSLLVSGHQEQLHWIGLARVAAAAVLLLGFPYPGGPRTGRAPVGGYLFRLGFLSWLVAGAVELGSGGDYVADGLLVAGSVLVAAALLRVGRRSIAVRVAASGAMSLLLVVVVLALALSAVITSKVNNQEFSQLSANSSVVESEVSATWASVATDAEIAQAHLAVQFTSVPGSSSSSGQIQGVLGGLNPANAVAYVDSTTGTTVASAGDPSVPQGASAQLARQTRCSGGQEGLFYLGNAVWLEATSPECNGDTQLGVVVAAARLDGHYLKRASGFKTVQSDKTFQSDKTVVSDVSVALLSHENVYALDDESGKSAESLKAAISAAKSISAVLSQKTTGGLQVTKAISGSFVSVTALTVPGSATEPLRVTDLASGRTVPLTLFLDDQSGIALATRNDLFQTLFLIAFGGTVLALGLAIFTGDRITAGLRRLTRAAAGIAAGDTTLRAGVGGDDEVASLGSAFDAMLDSVSAQAAALQAAAEDEARLRNRLQEVVAGMSDALVAVDAYGHITDFNQAAVDLTGVEADRAVGAPAADIVELHNEEGVPIARQLLQVGSRNTAVMARVVRGDTEIPVAVSSGALRGPAGEAVGTVLVFRDMRREQEVEQMKTEFLSRIGHELRTPLTGILGYADILLRRTVPEERARAWYEDILQSARRLLRIVEMLEFFASEGAGRSVLRPEPVDVRALVNGIASSWTGRLPANLTIGRRLPKGETVVTADQRWLTLAVDELIDNAVKFSPEGGRIVIKVDSKPDLVEISVSDQGMGMTSQHYDVIFGDFMQGDNSDTRRFGGLGLGLAVVRRVVEGHGGTINCESAPGRGTTFVIGLPVWTAEGPKSSVATTAAAAGRQDGRQDTPRRLRRPLRALRPSPTERGKAP